MNNNVRELSSLIKHANHVVLLTGAGMDTESNIPDFRGKDGWWKNLDPRVVADISTFNENYLLFHEFYTTRFKLLDKTKPHKGHYILAELEDKGYIKSIATQNVSRLHALAGSKEVYELHGNIMTFRCNDCNKAAEAKDFFEMEDCSNCGVKALRPNVTLFGEALPSHAWNNTISEIEKSDLLIVIGSSLEVSPVNQIPYLTSGKTVYINDEISSRTASMFDLIVKGKAKEVLKELQSYLN